MVHSLTVYISSYKSTSGNVWVPIAFLRGVSQVLQFNCFSYFVILDKQWFKPLTISILKIFCILRRVMHYERYSLHSCSMISLFFFFTYTLSSSREISPQCPCSVSSDVKGEAEIFCSHVTLMTTPRMWVPGGLERRLLDPLSCAHLPELTQFLPSCSQNKFRSRVTGSQISLM